MRILAIETSCDETALALVEVRGGLKNPRFKIFKNLVASQIKIHQPYGGVVPNLAKREHTKNLPILFRQIFGNSKFKIPNYKFKTQNIDLIAVTVGPGLEPCLWTGINFSREIYRELTTNNKQPTTKIIGVSHLEGHLYSFLLSQKSQWSKIFPAISLVVSGGHTNLLLMKDLVHYKKLGETRDDAVGECFDKVARLLGLNYPGGPEIEKLAQYGNPKAINFPRPMINQKNYDFSFSGLKTAVLYYLRDPQNNSSAADIAASFQAAAFDVLINKTLRAANEYKAKSVIISGGVASNKTLQKQFKSSVKSQLSNVNFFAPVKKFCTDNAVMIAVAGYLNYLQGKKRRLVAQGGLTI